MYFLICYFHFFGYITKSRITGLYGLSFLIFWGSFILFSMVTKALYIPANSAQGFPFSISSPTLVISCLFFDSQSNMCEVISNSDFDGHFPDSYWYLAPFRVPVGHLDVFFRECLLSPSALLNPFLFICFNWNIVEIIFNR